MAFTLVEITAQFERADGSPSQGTVTARCTAAMTNGVLLIDRVPATGRLDDEGKLVDLAGDAFLLAATNDEGTTPTGQGYEWTLEIDEAPIRAFDAPLPHVGNGVEPEEGKPPAIDLSELEP
jgi:hypothetical protein